MAREDDIDALLASLGPASDDRMALVSAQARSRRRWARQRAAESTTMAGVLVSLAERTAVVTLGCGPWTHRGPIRSVTEALTVVEVAEGVALLPTAAITTVEAPLLVADDRVLASGPDLAGVLATVVAEHPPVRLLLADGTELVGTLLEVGKDVALVRLRSSVVTCRLSALAGCVLLARGTG